MQAAVLGIGNTLCADDGIGVRVVEVLQADYAWPDDVRILDGGTAGMELLDALSGLDFLLVVDAIHEKQPPGTLIRLAGEDVPVFFRRNLSPHGIGLSDVLAALEFTGAAPRETVVLGVEPCSLALSTALTPLIAERLPQLVAQVLDELAAHDIIPACLPVLIGILGYPENLIDRPFIR